MKILIVTSSGDHLYQCHMLRDWWTKHDRVWVTKNDPISQELLKKETVLFGHFPEHRHLINTIKNFFLALKLIITHKPDLIFSTGAGIAPPFFIIAKFLGIYTIFIEIFVFIPKATLSGKLIYPFCDQFLVQNRKLLTCYPKAKLIDPIL